MTGCESLFEEQKNKYELVAVKSSDLLEDTFYVKSGTDFYAVYNAKGNGVNSTLKVDPKRVMWLMEDEALVPTLYKGEVLAYASSKNELTGTSLERYKDTGYSIGTYQMTWDESDEHFDFKMTDVIKDSPCYETFLSDKSDSFSIEEINSQKVSKDMVNAAGVFTCFEKDAEYQLSYYSGTYYEKNTFKASTHMLQAYELYALDKVEPTKNGYVEIHLPDDLKSGWYRIGGAGLFKYIDHEKDGSSEPELDAWNEPYFTNSEDSFAYAQKYSVSFATTTLDATINVTLDPDTINDEGVSVQAESPDGTLYDLTNEKVSNTYKGRYETEKGLVYSVTLDEAVPGKWYVYISPKTVTVTDVSVASAEFDEEKSVVEESFVLSEDSLNKTFRVTFKGDGDINGVVIAPDGQTYNLEKPNMTSKTYYYNMSYLKAGTYVVRVYHNTDTE
ncbi:MAG: hypothetical protein IKS09_00045, partial [Lachnospiraceae bacterium]|nr:hypothetical protein [Lachnospiraceae bacterium]